MTLNEFFTIYHIDCESNIEKMQGKVFEYFNIQPTEGNKEVFQSKYQYYTVKKKTKYNEWKKHRNLDAYKDKFAAIAMYKNEFPDRKPAVAERSKTPKRPTRDFSEVGSRQKRNKLTDLNSQLDDFARENNIGVNQVIGYLLYQRNYNTNKNLAKIGDELYKKGDLDESTRATLDIDHALALKSHINLSRNDLDFLKSFQKEFVHIPNRNIIREYSQTLTPSVIECREKRGIIVKNLQESVSLTISRLLDQLTKMNVSLPSNLTFKYKTGHDGAGGQSVYRANENPMSDPNIFAKMYVPLSLTDTRTQEILWKNETPNSAFYTRPLALIAEKESADLIRFINETFEPEEQKLRDTRIELQQGDKKYKVSLIIEDSMKDLKVRTIESGLGGADCLMCHTRQADWKNKDKINDHNTFQITRTAEKTLKLYEEMIADSGEIKKTKNDYGTRAGLTSEPLSSSDHHYLTLTHQYINGTSWFLHILYRAKANLLTWAIRGEENQKRLKTAKDSVVTSIQEKTGLKLDQMDSSAGNTGTSTTGQQGRRFFSYELREKIIESVPEKFKQNFSRLMHMYSVILRAVSSTQSLNIAELKKLTVEFSLFIANEFKWIDYNITVHNLIFHSAELVERNNGIGLGELSEEALESSNKDVRNYREFLARKCGHIPNLTDVFNRLFIRSDPLIRHIIVQSQPKREKRTSNVNILTTINEDDVLLSKILV